MCKCEHFCMFTFAEKEKLLISEKLSEMTVMGWSVMQSGPTEVNLNT